MKNNQYSLEHSSGGFSGPYLPSTVLHRLVQQDISQSLGAAVNTAHCTLIWSVRWFSIIYNVCINIVNENPLWPQQ